MSTLLFDYQSQVVAQIHAYLPELKTCTTHPGKMTLEELKKVGTRAPAVHVAMLDIPGRPAHTQDTESALTMVAYVTTRDTPRLPSEQAALNLVEALVNFIPGRQFHVAALPTQRVSARNLYSTKAGQASVSLWGITWRQELRFATEPDEPVLKTLYIDDTAGRDTIVIDAASQARLRRDEEFDDAKQ